jgi:sulfur carrier protein
MSAPETAMSAPETAATVTVNGDPRPYRDQSLEEVVLSCGLDPARRGIALALNARIVPRADWPAVRVAPGDKVEIVRPLAGG